ncbi:MAG: GntR family transcriptional regulator [Gammaproteobacteria bacterium]|nr:GntR family transcriptional regulator [Gammaproteobacteria bacterium]
MPQVAVVDAIRRAILADELVPGQRLVEAELCKLLGASRGTVRSALMHLVHEGLVERIENKGARVRVVGLEDALQIVEVRAAVESLCIRRAAERATSKDISALREMAKKLKDRAEQGDVMGFADLTHLIFEAYVRMADQPVAQEVLDRLRARNSRHRFRLTYRAGRARVSLPYWLAIVDGICRRDPDAAETALQRHVNNVRETMKAVALEHTPFAAMYTGEDASEGS